MLSFLFIASWLIDLLRLRDTKLLFPPLLLTLPKRRELDDGP